MTIEYLPGVAAGKKIDLASLPSNRFEKKPDFPRPETYLSELKLNLVDMTGRLNREYGDFLTANGQMKIEGSNDAANDSNLMFGKVQEWSQETSKTATQWLEDREKNPSNIAEIATTLLFDKVLREDFIKVRASVYDDYENGADQLIIDKKTGAVVCGLDDVIGHIGDDGGEKKDKKMRRKMAGGGAEIKYGATVTDGKLIKKSLAHIPLFYFSLSKKELDSLLRSLTAGEDEDDLSQADGLSQAEIEIYAKLVNSLTQQAAQYAVDKSLHPQLQDNLRRFKPSLEKMTARLKTNSVPQLN